MVHALSLQVNSDFGNNPRWLWEGVAQYLAGERRDTDQESLAARPCPGLTELSGAFDGGGTIYHYGFAIADFIERTWGYGSVLALIRNNGNIESVLRISEQRFDQLWCHHLKGLGI
ncbi:MAG: hypothetical protein AB8B96_22460 [Lysobacterales bacterium]